MQDDAEQSRDDVVLRDAFGVVAALHDEVERQLVLRALRERADQVVAQHGSAKLRQRGERVACCRRIGRVGRDQQFRLLVAQQAPRKIGRNHDRELHVAA